ncbi:hypothetical protein ACFQHV_06485 [Promicromonospora thailandica]|uniref:Uncharacterized protein n=1 Tax=Promicromonospora thailandica TaxID=765201 RepID=A0A9X2GC46_9MICO|nr:hypothetical protein [Promicromonospora thailandica]MCP2266411.1 hypothetical protein [Promicromonospora thailandica]BFF20091.1 hypothetical protein GCM10025730_36120 [Promicromonospora thailandica]
MTGTRIRTRLSGRVLATTAVAGGAALTVMTPFSVAVLLGLTTPRCGPVLFDACGAPSPWWVSAVYFLAAALLLAVPPVAALAVWRSSWSRAGLALGLLVLGLVVLAAPSWSSARHNDVVSVFTVRSSRDTFGPMPSAHPNDLGTDACAAAPNGMFERGPQACDRLQLP